MSEENKALYRSFIEEVFINKNLAAVDKYIAPDCVDHAGPPGLPPGPEGAKQMIGMYLSALPDAWVKVEDQIAEGDKVVSRLTWGGTHRGELMGVPATGKQVSVAGIDIVRCAGGKIVEHWESFDMLGMLQQIGAVPPPQP